MGAIAIILFVLTVVTKAGPYTEAGVNGYIGDDWRHANPLEDEDAIINPIFRGWATAVENYEPAPGVGVDWDNPDKALGPVTGNHMDIVSLGDLSQSQIDGGVEPGQITLVFGDPCDSNDPNHIRNVKGYDFVIFENGVVSNYSTGGGSVAGAMFAELGYVDVSSNGVDFARFPSVSLTDGPVGAYGTVEISNIYNLAGKHPNAYGVCVGTPFDLSEIVDEPNVVSGLVDVNNISYVRIVDIPGSGDFYDNAVKHTDPNSWPYYTNYDANHPIYDAWLTWGSGGFDLEAIGVLHEQEYSADINLDGVVDFYDFAVFAYAWRSHFGGANWVMRCDLAEPKDYIINMLDYAVFANQWLKVEQWRSQ
jgi:hypothetical protein